MTEQKPKLVALNVNQWKAVVLSDISTLHQALTNIQAPTDETLTKVDEFLANTRNMLHGWRFAGAQAAAAAAVAQVAAQPEGEKQAVHAGNGATPPKRKGGWPAGKPRGSKNAGAAPQ